MPASIKILVADDSPDDRFILERALRKTGLPVEIFEVEDGQEAIEFLSQRGRFGDPEQFPWPDLLLLDLKMPGYNGFDVLSWIQQHPGPRPLKTIVLSGSEMKADIQQAQALGAVAYTTKPPAPEQLRDLIATQIRSDEP